MLAHDGLVKLIEECGEVVQIAAKQVNYSGTDIHPDGAGSMRARLEDEIGDLCAAIAIVITLRDLNQVNIYRRAELKTALFEKWARET